MDCQKSSDRKYAKADDGKYKAGTQDTKENVRFLEYEFEAESGMDLKNFIGVEARARLTLIDIKAGPAKLHIGFGFTTGVKFKDMTLGLKSFGCGLKVGKYIGFAVYDNEFEIETLASFKYIWRWIWWI